MVFNPPTLQTWMDEVDKEEDPAWIIPGWLPMDAAVLIDGPAKRAKKSLLMFSQFIAASTGQAIGPLIPEDLFLSLIIETEGPRKPTRRSFKQLCNGFGIKEEIMAKNVYFLHRQPTFLDDPLSVREVAEFVKEHNIKLVAIDTLAKNMKGDENNVKDISAAMRGIDKIRAGGACVVYLHHTGKNGNTSKDIDDETRGSSALSGYYDVHIALREIMPGNDTLAVTIRSKFFEEKYYTIDWKFDNTEVNSAIFNIEQLPSSDGFLSVMMDSCFNLMSDDEDGYSIIDLNDLWGVPRNQTRRILDLLLEKGLVVKAQKGRWCRA
jgi:RecA-family ATPase